MPRRNPKSSAPSKQKKKKVEDVKQQQQQQRGQKSKKGKNASKEQKLDPRAIKAKAAEAHRNRGPTELLSPLTFSSRPQDLSGIYDRRIQVDFEHAAKKASATKIKALEDLLDCLNTRSEEGGEIEDVILETWVRLGPEYHQSLTEMSHRFRYIHDFR
jgi:hypothetical protein